MKTNTQLQRDVMDELEFEPSVNASNIGVSAKDGIVTLTGKVSNYAEKYAASEAAGLWPCVIQGGDRPSDRSVCWSPCEF
jgi:osmotically-inducible protein OsmY